MLKRCLPILSLLLPLSLVTKPADAELIIHEAAEEGGWEVFTRGRVNAFLGYAFGDGYPPAPVNQIVDGAGFQTAEDAIPELGPDGEPDSNQQATLSKFRVRNGFSPNQLTVGARGSAMDNLDLEIVMTLWGTIETFNQRKYVPVDADFREGYGKASGTWGTLIFGRAISLFSRGITEIDYSLAHNYAVGYWGGKPSSVGPTAGLIGFGVLANSHSPGIMYETPDLGGLQVAAGIYDPVALPGFWESTREPRPEAEITYDIDTDFMKAHLFVNGGWQKLYKTFQTESQTMVGAGYGAKLDFGKFKLGGGGHYGTGLGLFYALDGSETNVGGNGLSEARLEEIGGTKDELRTFDGWVAIAQLALGSADIHVGAGQSRVHQLDADRLPGDDMAPSTISLIRTQTGLSAGAVYHFSDNFHLSLDVFHAMFEWYKGEKQNVTFINGGPTANW